MQKNLEYEIAKKNYFGISCKIDRELAEVQLNEIIKSTENNTLKGKCAYFLAAINLTDKTRAVVSLRTSASPNPKVHQYLNEGLTWLRKSHALGYEPATLLLARMAMCDDDVAMQKLQIPVDEKSLGTIPVIISCFDLSAASNLLQTIGKKNLEAAQHLKKFAIDFLTYIESIMAGTDQQNYEDRNQPYKFLALMPMFTDPIDLDYGKFYSQCGDEASRESDNFSTEPTQEDQKRIVLDLIKKTIPFAVKGSFRAIEFMHEVYSGTSPVTALINSSFPADQTKTAELDQILWQKKLQACDLAIQWLENAQALNCPATPTTPRIDSYRLCLDYLKARVQGKDHDSSMAAIEKIRKEKQDQIVQSATQRLGNEFFSSNNPLALFNKAKEYRQNKDPQAAIICLERAVAIFKEKAGTKSLECGDCYYELALCRQSITEFNEALNMYDLALQILQKLSTTDTLDAVLADYKNCLNISGIHSERFLSKALELLTSGVSPQAKILLEHVAHDNSAPSNQMAAFQLLKMCENPDLKLQPC